jgi:hypothetical protein
VGIPLGGLPTIFRRQGAWRGGGRSATDLTLGHNRDGDRDADGRTRSLARDRSRAVGAIRWRRFDASARASDAKRLQASELRPDAAWGRTFEPQLN